MNRCHRPLKPWAFKSTIRQWLILLLFVYLTLVLSLHIFTWLDLNHIPIALCYATTLVWLFWVRPYASTIKEEAEQVGDGDAEEAV